MGETVATMIAINFCWKGFGDHVDIRDVMRYQSITDC